MRKSILALIVLGAAHSAAADTQPPTNVSGTSAAAISDNSIRVTWNRPLDDVGVQGYNVYRNGLYVTTVFNTNYIDSNLSANETYRYGVVAFDQAKNFSRIGEEASANTASGSTNNAAPPPDQNGGPSIPTNLSSEITGGNSAVIRWNTSSGDIRGYNVYRDNSYIATVASTEYRADNLDWGRDYEFQIVAHTNADQFTRRSSTLVVNTANGSSAANDNVRADNAVQNTPVQSNNTPIPENDNGLIDPATFSQNFDKAGYELVFSDEFNNNALNRARWNTQLRWDGQWNGERYEYRVVNGEAQFYVNIFSPHQEHLEKVANVYNPFQFDGNRLAIRSTRNPIQERTGTNSYGPLASMSTQQPFLSGVISTYDKFSTKFGYFEARIKIPAHVGTFPAFWLHHQRTESQGTQKTEIDIMENLGHAPHYVYNSFHYFTDVSPGFNGTAHSIKPSPQGQISNGGNYSDDYHVYAVDWKPGHIQYFIDGQKVSEVRNSNSDYEELYIIMNLAVGGIWTNLPTNAGGSGRTGNDRFPTQNDINNWQNPALEIDYVRVYKQR